MTTSPGWTPSNARTIGPVLASGTPARGTRIAASTMSWPSKAAVEQLDYTLDLSAWLADAADLLLQVDASATPAGSPQDLVVQWSSVVDGWATLFLTGGVPGVAYMVAVQVRTAAARVARFTINIQVTSDLPPPAPVLPVLPPMVLLDTGYAVLFLAPGVPLLLPPPNVLTDATGAPLFLTAATPFLLS